MPHLIGVLGHRDADIFLSRFDEIEKTKIHRGRVLGEDGEVRAIPHPSRAEWIWVAEPDFYRGHKLRSVLIRYANAVGNGLLLFLRRRQNRGHALLSSCSDAALST